MENKGKARILLVDDEPALNKLMQTYLTRIGYTVDTAFTATDGLAAFNSSTEPYDLIVADLTLPDGQGDEMALEMVAKQPNLRVLVCSGYAFAIESLPEHARSRFSPLQKPFLPNMLAESIEDLLKTRAD